MPATIHGLPLDPLELAKKARKRIAGSDPDELQRFLYEEQVEGEALFVYRAIERFPPHQKEQNSLLERNIAELFKIREEILKNSVEESLESYSIGFYLGALVSILRETEASIKNFSKFKRGIDLISNLEKMKNELSSDMKPLVIDSAKEMQELNEWFRDKAQEYSPLITKLVQYSQNKYSDSLLRLRRQWDDKTIFFALISLARTNAYARQKLVKKCQKVGINEETLVKHIWELLEELGNSSEDEKVINYLKLVKK